MFLVQHLFPFSLSGLVAFVGQIEVNQIACLKSILLYSTLLEFSRKYKNPSAIILCKKLKNFCLNGIEIIS